MDITDWLVDGALYRLPDGTIVRAAWEERDDMVRWILRDRAGQRLFAFMDDGRVRAYARADERTPTGQQQAARITMVPCDLTLEDLQPYRAADA